tara:strand:- start:2515 stop:2793 length:279 start_codon:yes stop_codon:yes gene_type:complete
MKLLDKALKQMPREFSSKSFNKAVAKLNIMEEPIKSSVTRCYLEIKCDNTDRKCFWTKKAVQQEIPDAEKYIDTLKSLGYKIQRPVTQWEEV